MIPVEISLDGDTNSRELKPGMNASVYIHRSASLSTATNNTKQQAAGKTGQ
jgi:hypothetical protein